MRAPPAVESAQSKPQRGIRVILALAVLTAAVLLFSVNVGYLRIPLADVVKTLFGMGTEQQRLAIFEFRLPRMVLAVLVGAGLAVSGCILQGISRNALADPGILGIHAGAGLAVMVFVAVIPVPTARSVFALPAFAFFGAACAALLIFVLAYKRHHGIPPNRLILTGIAVAAGIHAAMIVLTMRMDPAVYQFAATWLAGSMWGTSWKFVTALAAWMIVLLPLAFFKSRVLDVLQLGQPTAIGLGVSVAREQWLLLIVAVGLAGSSVSVSGSIGFVGLIGPHLARKLVGVSHRLLLPASALTGGLLLLTADTIGRGILQPAEVPAGLVVAVIGAPYFLYLLCRLKS